MTAARRVPPGPIHMVDLTCRSAPYEAELVPALRREGVDVTLWLSGCLPDQEVDLPGMRRTRGGAGSLPLRARRTRALAKSVEYTWNAVHLLRSCPAGGVVHFQWLPLLERWPGFDLWLVRSLRRRGARVVYTVHNVLPHDSGGRLQATYRRAYAEVDALVCHTRASRDRLVADFGVDGDSVHVIPHGPLPLRADPGVSAVGVRRELGLGPDQPFVLAFGFMRPYKGVEELIQAWADVRASHPDLRLVLAGSGEEAYTDRLESMIREAGLGPSVVTSFRFLPDPELRVLIREAALLVFPYREVTQSGALLAGMAAGAAIIATDVGGFGEAVEHGISGWLVDPGSSVGLGEAIHRLMLAPDQRLALGRRARERAEDAFGWARIARATLACYTSVSRGEGPDHRKPSRRGRG